MPKNLPTPRLRPECAPAPTTLLRPDVVDACMARLADGDRSAFECVFRALWPVLLRFCAGVLRHEQDAADAAQEALRKIFERAGEYDSAKPALSWALAIASWECRTLIRKRVRRREVADTSSDPRSSVDPDAALVQADLVRAALLALEQLSERDRDTLIATFLDEATSVTGATLRKRRERALQRLRNIWRRLYGYD